MPSACAARRGRPPTSHAPRRCAPPRSSSAWRAPQRSSRRACKRGATQGRPRGGGVAQRGVRLDAFGRGPGPPSWRMPKTARSGGKGPCRRRAPTAQARSSPWRGLAPTACRRWHGGRFAARRGGAARQRSDLPKPFCARQAPSGCASREQRWRPVPATGGRRGRRRRTRRRIPSATSRCIRCGTSSPRRPRAPRRPARRGETRRAAARSRPRTTGTRRSVRGPKCVLSSARQHSPWLGPPRSAARAACRGGPPKPSARHAARPRAWRRSSNSSDTNAQHLQSSRMQTAARPGAQPAAVGRWQPSAGQRATSSGRPQRGGQACLRPPTF
mmetsp:Transcript_58907/g.149246  ORF Transcript_58907/g.149246 Transcript_58907/m.149246 type:complete len:329 (-) Transcript_58907:990-1976(-)